MKVKVATRDDLHFCCLRTGCTNARQISCLFKMTSRPKYGILASRLLARHLSYTSFLKLASKNFKLTSVGAAGPLSLQRHTDPKMCINKTTVLAHSRILGHHCRNTGVLCIGHSTDYTQKSQLATVISLMRPHRFTKALWTSCHIDCVYFENASANLKRVSKRKSTRVCKHHLSLCRQPPHGWWSAVETDW